MFVARVIEALPALIVLVGLVSLRARSGRFLPRFPPEDVLLSWCAAALFSKQALFMYHAGLEWRSTAIWGMAFGAVAPVGLILVVPSASWRAALAWLAAATGSTLLFIDSLYHAWFGDMFPVVASVALSQISRLLGGIRPLLSWAHAWALLDLVLAVPLVVAVWRTRSETLRWPTRVMAASVVAALVGVSGWRATAPIRANATLVTQRFSNLSLVETIGPLPFHGLDSWLLARRVLASELISDAMFEEVLSWLRERAPLRAGPLPWFGVATGKNLIVIQVESLQAQLVDLEINGQRVMPNLHRLASNHMSFTQVVDQTDEGRSSDAEWLMLTSQLPEAQGAATFANASNHLVGLPAVLAARGYESVSAVPFSPPFWNRRVMHQNLGFFRSYFEGDFAPGERIGWGLNDRDFLLQMVPRLAALRQPFMAWLITLSLHHPFESFPAQHTRLRLGHMEGASFGNYLHGMHFLDQALGDFMAALDREGLLDRSVLVVTGDHSAGFRWSPDVAHALGFSNDLANWTLAERVPLVVRIPGVSPLVVDRPVGQLDFSPTMLGLLGVDASVLPYVGRNSLGNPDEEPVIRRKGGWLDAEHLFLLRGPTTGSHCYDRRTLQDVALAECEAGGAVALRKALTARWIQQFDLQQRLYARLTADATVR